MTRVFTPGSASGADETGNIIVIPANGQYPGCRDLEAYWEGLRAGRIVPSRSDFDPRGVEASLAQTFVAEKVAPRVARIRVAGSHLADLLGMDVRGMPLSAFLEPDSRDALGDAIEQAFNAPERVTIDLISQRSFGRRILTARMVLMPMSDSDGKVTRLVGCFETPNAPKRMPRRFSISQIHSHPLSGTRPKPDSMQPEEPARPPIQQVVHAPTPTAPKPFAFSDRAQTPFKPQDGGGSQEAAKPSRAHLRLVVSND